MMLSSQRLTERVRIMDDVAPVEPLRRSLSVAVVTICAYGEQEAVRVLCKQNRELYKMLHGYDVHFFTDASQIDPNVDSKMDATRMKLQVQRHEEGPKKLCLLSIYIANVFIGARQVNDGVHKPFFWKVNAVKNVLETGKYDWALWSLSSNDDERSMIFYMCFRGWNSGISMEVDADAQRIDCDAFFMDPGRTIDSIIEMYTRQMPSLFSRP